MENNKNQSNILNNQELMSLSQFSNGYNSILSFKENYIPHKLRKKSRQLSSKSIKAKIKYEYSISKNNKLKENITKNEHDIKNLSSLSTGKILRTQSWILNNKKDEFLLIKNEYTCRNKGFENLNMDKISGSTYRKLLKDKNNNNVKNNNKIQSKNKNDIKENIKVIKEYTINYDTKILNENDIKNELNKENQNINNNEYLLLLDKSDYFKDKNESNINNDKNIILNMDKQEKNEIKLIPKPEPEIKNRKKLFTNKIKSLISKKENTPFNIKQKLFNINKDINFGFSPRNKINSNIFSYKHFNCKKNKFPEENNKTMNKIKFNNRFELLNPLNYSNNRSNINKKMNNFNLYNKCSYLLKKGKFNSKQYWTNRAINLINRFDNYENKKGIMPPNNLKNIFLKKEKEYFDIL